VQQWLGHEAVQDVRRDHFATIPNSGEIDLAVPALELSKEHVELCGVRLVLGCLQELFAIEAHEILILIESWCLTYA